MKICLVTTFPPSQGGLSEYGLHIAEQLRRNRFLSLTILRIKYPRLNLSWMASRYNVLVVRRSRQFASPSPDNRQTETRCSVV